MKRSEGVDTLGSEKVEMFYSKNKFKFQAGIAFKPFLYPRFPLLGDKLLWVADSSEI